MFKFIKSVFTDKDWDGDATKLFGFMVVVSGLIGFFIGRADFQWVILFGSGLIASGKFSKEG